MRKKILSVFLCVLCAAALCAALFAVQTVSLAEEPARNEATLVKHETQTEYRYFTYPSALHADAEGFAVADGAVGFTFLPDGTEKTGTLTLPENTRKLRLLQGLPLTLADGTLRYDGAEVTDGVFCDFDLAGNTVFAVGDSNIGTVRAFKLQSEALVEDGARATGFAVKKIAASGDGLYVTRRNEFDAYCDDLLFYPNGQSTPAYVLAGIDEAQALAAFEDGVLVLSRENLTLFVPKGGVLVPLCSAAAADVVDVAPTASTVYALTRQKGVCTFDKTLAERTQILASAHDELDFFNAPSGLTARKNYLLVADERNDRVQILSDAETKLLPYSFYRPKAVAMDYSGSITVAHNGGVLTRFSPDLKKTSEATAPAGAVIVDLAAVSDTKLLALASSGQLYEVQGETFRSIAGANNLLAVALSQTTDEIFGLTNDKRIVRILSDDTLKNVIHFGCNAVDFCTDHDNSLFLLCADGKIEKYELAPTLYVKATDVPTAFDGFVRAARIEMNTVASDSLSLGYGDLLVTDTGGHCVRVVSGKTLKTNKQLPATDEPPAIPDADTPASVTDNRILFRLTAGCDVYAQRAEMRVLAHLPEDMRVIVPDFDKTEKFNFVVADNLSDGNGAAITGYVYTAYLEQPSLPYTAEHAEACYTWTDTVAIYKYPTRNSPVLKDYKKLAKNQKLKLLDFGYTQSGDRIHYGYVDNFYSSITWYRVAFGDDYAYEGYVVSDYISVRGANPDERNIYPRVNAVIVSKDSSNDGIPAVLYEKTTGEDGKTKFVPIEDKDFAPLAVGTKVEVIGAFDTTEKYTQIKYFLEGYGTVTAWVETANLKYDGIDKVNVVAVVLIVVTAVLIVTLIATLLIVKKMRKADVPTKI